MSLTEAKGSSLLLDDQLASTANGKGASLVAVEDSAGNFSGADVEAVLAELFGVVSGFLSSTLTKASNYTVVAADDKALINVSGTSTITLLPAATASNGFVIAVRNSGVNTVTIDGDGAETINGAATISLTDTDHWAILTCNGTSWSALVYTPAASASVAGFASVGIDPFLQYNGDSSDGVFTSVGASTISNFLYNHTTFALNSGHILTVDVPVCIIRAATSIVIEGTLNGRGVDISGGAGAALDLLGSSPGSSGGGGGGGGEGNNEVEVAPDGEDGGSSQFQKGGAGGKGWNLAANETAGSTGVAVAANQKELISQIFSALLGRGGGSGGDGGKGGTGENGGNYYVGGAGGVGGKAGCLLILIAPTITIDAAAVIDLTGQTGTAGVGTTWGGGGGGGGGGAGGTLMKVSSSITDSGTTTLTAGGAGTGAANGGAGAAGYAYEIDPS